MESVFYSKWNRKCRGLTPTCSAPPPFNSPPKVYTKPRENAGERGVEGDPQCRTLTKNVERDPRKGWRTVKKTVYSHMYN